MYGLQTDGTGLVDDPIALSYGSEVGVPASITWYRDSRILATYTDKAQSYGPLNGLAIGSTATAAAGVNYPNTDFTDKEGTYWAIITTTDGKKVKSNEIELTMDETRAVIMSFSIEDDYETGVTNTTGATKLDYSTTDGQAIATVVLNRAYDGKFRLAAANDSNYSAIGETTRKDKDTSTTGAKGFTAETNPKKMTNEDVTGATTSLAKVYVDPDYGTATYRWVIGNAGANGVTRGKDYIVLFDQDDIKDDTIGQGNENISDEFTAPYIVAPASAVISQFAQSTETKVDFLDENGDALAWYDSGVSATGLAGFDTVKLYNIKSGTTSSSDTATNPAGYKALKGTATLTTASALSDLFVYGTLATTKGIFGKESVTLTTPVSEGATAAASSVKLEEDGTTASAAKISFESFRTGAAGKLVIYQGTSGHVASAQDIRDNGTKVKEVEIEGGLSSTTVADVFSGIDTQGYLNNYVAVIVPEDTVNYKEALSNQFVLGQVATSLKFTKDTPNVTVTTGVITITDPGLKAYDQFGKVMTTAQTDKAVTSVTMTDKTIAHTERATAVYKVAPNAQTTITLTPVGDTDRGDGYTISVLGSTITCMASNDGQDSTKSSSQGLVVKVGSEELFKGVYAKNVGNGNTTALASAAATAATGAPTIAIDITAADDLIGDDGNKFVGVSDWKDSVTIYSDSAMETATKDTAEISVAKSAGGGAASVATAEIGGTVTLTAGTYYFKWMNCKYTLTVTA